MVKLALGLFLWSTETTSTKVRASRAALSVFLNCPITSLFSGVIVAVNDSIFVTGASWDNLSYFKQNVYSLVD